MSAFGKTAAISLLALLTLIIPDFNTVQASQWVQTNGPAGGWINVVEIDSQNPDILYAGGAGGGIYKTVDGGETWFMTKEFGDPTMYTIDIIVSWENSQQIYALAGGLIYKSDDGGVNWLKLDFFGGIECISMSVSDSSVLAAGLHSGEVYYSKDSGETWSDDISGSLPDEKIWEISMGAVDEIWVGTVNQGKGGLYHTIDGGKSWNQIDLDKGEASDVNTIFVDPSDTNSIYVGLFDVYNEVFDSEKDNYLLKSVDGGNTWISLRLPGTDGMVNIMGRAREDDALYVGTGDRVYRSTDNGSSWSNITPPGRSGDMCDIAVDPRNTDVLYLPRRAHGIVKTEDRGDSWTPINQGLLNTSISLLALPDTPGSGTVYAATVNGEGTFVTEDNGDSWTNVVGGGITHPWTDELVISPHDPETVWEVADVGEVFMTENGGTTWKKIIDTYGAGFRYGSIHAVAPAPSNPDILYALKSGFGIFKTENRGISWRFLHQSEIDYSYSMVVHPENPNIVFSGYNSKPFQNWAMVRRTTDGGNTWDTSLHVDGAEAITSVVFDPSDHNTLYAGSTGSTGGKIFKSADGGNNWSNLNEHFIMNTVWGQPQLIVDPNDPSIAYAGTWLAGTWKTTNAGAHWTLLKNAPVSATSLSLTPSNSNVIYLSDRTAPKVWKSIDGGATWEVIGDFSSNGAFLVNRVLADGDRIYAATFGPGMHGGKLYKSTDAGKEWIDITGGLPRSVLDIAVNPDNPDIVYVTTHIYGAYKSVNGGADWTEMQNFPDIGAYDIEVDQVDPHIVYTCGMGGGTVPDWCMAPDGYTFSDDSGVYRSTDSGATWEQLLRTDNECRAIRLHPDDHTTLFASAMDDGLQVSTDAGKTWRACNEGLDTKVLTSCTVGGSTIYVGTQGFGVYSGDLVSTGGMSVTWQPDRSNKPSPQVYSLQIEIDPANPERIFVGANPGGLYRSDDGGATFYDKNFLTPSVVVEDPYRQGYYNFAINPKKSSQVWLGTWGKGIYKSYDGMDFDIGASGADRKMYGKHIYEVVVDPHNDAPVVYAATEEGVYKTTDEGVTWSDFSTGLDNTQVRTLDMLSDGTLVCGTLGYELYYYDPPEKTWRQMPGFGNYGTFWPLWDDRPLYQYTTLLFDPVHAENIYVGTFPAGIYKSTDGGQSWRERNVGWTNDGVFSLVFRPGNTKIIYAGTYNGVNRSLDAGEHWEMWDKGWPDEQWVFSIDFDQGNPDIMYACSKNGENEGRGREEFHGTVMKSMDGGANWFPITNGLQLDNEFYKIIVDRHDPNTLYLASQCEGVFISHDGGAGWSSWNEGLTNLKPGTNGNNVTNTMVMSADGNYLYFGSAGSGVFRRALHEDTDGDGLADSWERAFFKDLTTTEGTGDQDKDRLTDRYEYRYATDPTNGDTDGDGMSDAWEVDTTLNPLLDDGSMDWDEDSYTNLEEYFYGTDPHDPESKPIVGDIDGSGSVDLADAILAGRILTGESPDGIKKIINISGNSTIRAEEMIYILQGISGLR